MTENRFMWQALLLRGRIYRFFLRRFTSGDHNPIPDLIEQTYHRFEQSVMSPSCNADQVTARVMRAALQVGMEWRSRSRRNAAVIAPNPGARVTPDPGTGTYESQGVLEFARTLEPVLDALPDRARDAFRQRQNGSIVKVIAAHLGVGTATVNRDLSMVNRAVEQTLDDDGGPVT